MAMVECRGLADGRSCWDRSSTSSIISSVPAGQYWVTPAGSFTLTLPPCWILGEMLWPHWSRYITFSWTCLLSRVLPRKGHRPLLIPSIIPNLSEIFIPAPHNPPTGGLVCQGQSTRGIEAPKLSLHLLNFPPSCSPGSACPVSRLRHYLNNILPNPLLVHICPFWLPEALGCCDSNALRWLLFSLFSAVCFLTPALRPCV